MLFAGDPEDKTLRKVEKEIMIPQIMKKKIKENYCHLANQGWLDFRADWKYRAA